MGQPPLPPLPQADRALLAQVEEVDGAWSLEGSNHTPPPVLEMLCVTKPEHGLLCCGVVLYLCLQGLQAKSW